MENNDNYAQARIQKLPLGGHPILSLSFLPPFLLPSRTN